MIYNTYIKPCLDTSFSITLMIVSSPLLLLISLLILIFHGHPIIFKQMRTGYKEKLFTLYKFRTMCNEKDSDGNLLPDHKRLTKFGKFLRTSSLDELPELYNIIRGEMSFIGPRPLLIQYLPLYNSYQKRRHNVKPGLSGLAQVSGRNAISWEEKFNYDIFYVENVSIWLDIKILFLTFIKTINREGINSSDTNTMEAFKGS